MQRDEAIALLRAVEPEIRAHGVGGLFLFGSVARDAAEARSDIDVFVDPDPARRFGFNEFMAVYELLQERLGAEAITRPATAFTGAFARRSRRRRSASSDGRPPRLLPCAALVKRLVLTYHAGLKIRQRHLDLQWIERTARHPEWTQADPYQPEVERRFRSIEEFGGRVLRVACVETVDTIRVISAVFDRGARRRR